MNSSPDEEIIEKIAVLKKERDAMIIAHSFQPPDIQGIADYVGGTREILQKAMKAEEKVIVVGGVYFMAEMIAAIRPGKIVLIPDLHANCPMIRMLEIEKLREAKASNPGIKVVSYIKSTLESIAESDYCWTSDKALEMLTNTEDDILFTPNTHLGQNLARWSKKKLALLGGYCPPHVKILAKNVKKMKGEHPNAVVLAHPECRGDVVKLVDDVMSSEALTKFVRRSKEKEFIIASEMGLIHRLTRENPDKKFYPASAKALCQNMKLIDLGKIYWSLKEMIYRVKVPEDTASKAGKILEKTLFS